MSIIAKLIAALALLAALFFAEQYVESRGYDRAKAEDKAATEQIKREAADQLATLTGQVREKEHALQAVTDTQNIKDKDHEKTISNLSDRLRRAAGPAGRLRDPNATAGCGGSGSGTSGQAASSAGDRASDTAETGGLLSGPITELFQQLTRDADDINAAYASCRVDAYSVRGLQPPP